jgi:hypothetical protein
MRRSKKRKIQPGSKLREMKFMTQVQHYDMLSAMAGPESLVGTFEELIEKEFVRRIKRMGFEIPPIDNSPC